MNPARSRRPGRRTEERSWRKQPWRWACRLEFRNLCLKSSDAARNAQPYASWAWKRCRRAMRQAVRRSVQYSAELATPPKTGAVPQAPCRAPRNLSNPLQNLAKIEVNRGNLGGHIASATSGANNLVKCLALLDRSARSPRCSGLLSAPTRTWTFGAGQASSAIAAWDRSRTDQTRNPNT